MTWTRVPAIAALAAAIATEAGETVTVFDRPPMTINPPAIVVSRPAQVLYSSPTFGIDTATVPVLCLGALEDDDTIDALVSLVRAAVAHQPTLGGAVQLVGDVAERGWRMVNVAGVDVLQAQVDLSITM